MEDLRGKKSSIVPSEEIHTPVTILNTLFSKLHQSEAVNSSELFVTTDTRPGENKLSSDQAIPSI